MAGKQLEAAACGPMRAEPPQPAEIIAGRGAAGLTQTQAAQLVRSTLRTWQQWEAGDRRMHPGLWELFRIKSALIERHHR